MKILKRGAALSAALLILLSIVIKPIKASAAASVTGAAIGAGWVLDLALSGYITGEAVEGSLAIKESLENGTIDNNVEQWLWDKASEWEYGYTQAQVNGEIFKAELTYGDLKALSALLSEAYPEGQISTLSGSLRTFDEMSSFRIPLDQPVYITDFSQHGETAVSYCLELYTSYDRNNKYVSGPANLNIKCSEFSLPSCEFKSIVDSSTVRSLPVYYGEYVSAYIIFDSGNLTVEYTLKDPREDSYNGTFTSTYPLLTTVIQDQFNDQALISTTLPTYVPGEGVGSASSADIQELIDALEDVPYGMSDDDIAVSIPVSGEDVGDNAGSDSKPGVDTSEIIENAPDVPIEGDFSSLKLPKTISTVFPFCLPFDFYNGIRLFSAQPVTPRFEIPVKIPNPTILGGGYVCDEVIVIDLAKFEKIGRLSRVLTTCAFLFFLIQLSTKIVKGAGA